MKNKLKATIMENWIEKIKEAIRIAMNKGLVIDGKYQELLSYYFFEIEDELKFFIYLKPNSITIRTKKGYLSEKYFITDRDDLELRTLVLSIKEYNENVAILELNKFISEKKDEITDINDLDDGD